MDITLPNNFVFWGCFGFEERSSSVLSELVNQGLHPAKSYIFWNRPTISRIKTNFSSFEKYIEKFSPIDIYYDHPIKTADIFISNLEKIKKQKVTNLVLDITTFTREWALILLAILNTDEYKKINVTIAYNFAATMSKEWLSMRPMQMRTVLGYPGKILPSRKNHLILILGHEIERAMAIIDEIEPAYITVVTGSKEGSVTMLSG